MYLPIYKPVVLSEFGSRSSSFDYIYDFGDHWHHVAIVEDRHIQTSPTSPVHCSAGENACPPEDVGGAHGYAEFLEALADPDHEEHERYVGWSGGNFDPKLLNLDAINLRLVHERPETAAISNGFFAPKLTPSSQLT